jgi:uncharacterized protein with FMN-binding domain
MTSLPGPLGPPRTLEAAARRVRARRILAMAGILSSIGGLVGLRAYLTPTAHQALQSSRLASPVHSGSGVSGRRARHHQSSSAKPSSPPAHQVVTGNGYDVSYGTVQVRVTWTGSRITDVRALSLPQGGRSSDISNYAAPQLHREAIAAQSARIDTVSGASYTSAGYARSLQSAIDKRGG